MYQSVNETVDALEKNLKFAKHSTYKHAKRSMCSNVLAIYKFYQFILRTVDLFAGYVSKDLVIT